MLVFTRHAERGDNQFPKQSSQIDYDPPITIGSTETIKQTAMDLIQIFKSNNIKKVRICSSKFLRCLMTAQKLIKHFKQAGFEIIEPMQVSNQITEYMREDWFSHYPLDSLIFDSQNRPKYMNMESWKQQKLDKSHTFPENYVMFHNRIGKYRSKLAFPSEGQSLVLVTHGFVVRELCWRMNQIANYAAQIKYCGYAVYKKIENRQILLKSKL